jgi:hypothetical protein
MPTSLPGLLLFVVLLLPGFVYVWVWERKAPHQRPSTFRETALVVFGSVLTELPILALFFAFRAVAPAATPDMDRLVREGSRYAETHWVSLTWWGLALLAASTFLAAAAAWRAAAHPHPSTQSAWYHLFAARPNRMKDVYGERPDARVCCFLDDGTKIEGTIAWFNQLGGDVTDRDLILVAPLIRWDEAGGRKELTSQAVCLPARSLQAFVVRYEFPPSPVVEAGAEGSGAGVTSEISDPGGAAGTGAGQAVGTE